MNIIPIGRKKDEERPIAVIEFGNEKKETKPGTVIGTNAIWGDQFILKIEDAFDFIEITVFSGKLNHLINRIECERHLSSNNLKILIQDL